MRHILIAQCPSQALHNTLHGFEVSGMINPLPWFHLILTHFVFVVVEFAFRFIEHILDFFPRPIVCEMLGILMVGKGACHIALWVGAVFIVSHSEWLTLSLPLTIEGGSYWKVEGWKLNWSAKWKSCRWKCWIKQVLESTLIPLLPSP